MSDHSQIRALGQRLARTELLSGEEFDAARSPLISKLLIHARQNTAYYKDRFDLELNSPESISRNWSSIPILTRAEAIANRDRLASRMLPPEAGAVRDGRTSGSTGMVLRYKSNQLIGLASVALTERMFRWWQVDGKKSYAQISQPGQKAISSQGATTRGWHSARLNGLKHFLSHAHDIDHQLDWLLERKPSYFASFAGIIKELAATTLRRGVSLRFDLIFSGAAPVDSDLRALCRRAFGAEIADTYGAEEVGHVAAECPECKEYHCSSDTSVVEILRDNGTPAAPGETGRVIVTPLYNYAMPLVRYELGDFAEVGSAGPLCPRTLPRLRRILGRYRNIFRFRDGTRIWPVVTLFLLNEFMRLKQFQIVQVDLDTVEIRYVPEGAPEPIDMEKLTERVRKVLKQPVNVTVRCVSEIERTATGKFEDCISMVPTQ